MSTALAIIHKDDILQRLSNGEQLVSIARSMSITPAAISQQLADDPAYQAAREDCLDARMIMREGMVEDAPDMLNLARAKELLRHSEFRASTEAPKRWGKTNTDAPVQIAPVFNVIMNSPTPAPVITYVVESQGGVKSDRQG